MTAGCGMGRSAVERGVGKRASWHETTPTEATDGPTRHQLATLCESHTPKHPHLHHRTTRSAAVGHMTAHLLVMLLDNVRTPARCKVTFSGSPTSCHVGGYKHPCAPRARGMVRRQLPQLPQLPLSPRQFHASFPVCAHVSMMAVGVGAWQRGGPTRSLCHGPL